MKPQVQGCTVTFAEVASENAVRRAGLLTLAAGCWQTLRIWRERTHRRKALRDLAELDDYLLKDIGLSREDVLREAAKPFWR